ncbi:MAG TPA: hypothetical protein EYO31_00680 [Phycisphaerales bacterium]|nr:hypothetical protein [Phycisphaerales bacterium]
MALLNIISPELLVCLLFSVNLGVGLVLPNNAAMAFSLFSKSIGMVGAIYGLIRMLVAAIIGMIIAACHFVTVEQMAILLMVINIAAIFLYHLPDYTLSKKGLITQAS